MLRCALWRESFITRQLGGLTGVPPKFEPSLPVLVAPFAVGFSAYSVTSGRIDLFAESLYALTLLPLAVLLSRLRHATSSCRFSGRGGRSALPWLLLRSPVRPQRLCCSARSGA